MRHIAAALAQVRIFKLLKLHRQLLCLRCKGPFGVVPAVRNDGAGLLEECRVIEDHGMHLQECLRFGGCIGRQMLADAVQLSAHRVNGTLKTRNLRCAPGRIDSIARHIDQT